MSARLYAGDDGGRVHGVDATQPNLPALGAGWPYRDSLSHTTADLDNCLFPITASPWVSYGSWRVSVGDADGHFYVLNSAGQPYNGIYPIRPTTSAFANSSLSLSGVIVAGTAGGQVFYIDESTGNLILTYNFGAGVVISPVTYQSSAQKFMIGTSTGGLYWLPKLADPTP